MRRLRAAPGLSQEAQDCGINRTYLSGVERSERNVSLDNIARIEKGLRVSASELLGGLASPEKQVHQEVGSSSSLPIEAKIFLKLAFPVVRLRWRGMPPLSINC